MYAEDPRRFLPSPGPIEVWQEPAGPGVRVDAGYTAGNTVTPFYDPLLAKLCVHGADRAQALERARAAVADFRITRPEDQPAVPRRAARLGRVHQRQLRHVGDRTDAGRARVTPEPNDNEEALVTEVRAEMVANVWKVVASAGDTVADGDTLVILESMKMEIPVLAEAAGTVSTLAVAEGDVVQEGDLIAVIE